MARFVFDFDETLVTGDVVVQASRELLKTGRIDRMYTNRDLTSWELDGVPTCVKERCIELFNDEDWIVWKKRPVPGSQVLLHTLKMMGHDIEVLTARNSAQEQGTREFIKKYFTGLINDVHFSKQDFKNKASKLQELSRMNADYFFDDNPTFCEEARMLGITTFMISNEETGWNNKCAIHNDIKRLRSVVELDWEIIQDIS